MAAKKKKSSVKNVKPTESSSPNPSSKRRFSLLALLAVTAVLLYLSRSLFLAAIVGGKPITRLSLIKEMEKRSGKQTLDDLISKQLVFQEAKKKNVVVSDQDINEEVEKIKKYLESQGTTLDAELAVRSQTVKDVEDGLRTQKLIEGILSDQIKVSDDEIQKYFEENKSFYPKDSKIEDLKDEIVGQLKQEKLSAGFATWLEQAKKDTKIIRLVNF